MNHQPPIRDEWDEETDFLVVGSGGGGMVAALRAHDLGAATIVIEKANVYGGSTALSGGVIWVPNNPRMAAAGISDSSDEAMLYLEKITAGSSSSECLRAYVDTAPQMMSYLDERSHLHFETIADYPDYYPEEPGGKSGGRSCEPQRFDARRLGEDFDQLRQHPREYLPGDWMSVLARDGKPVMAGSWQGSKVIIREILRYYLDVPERLKRRRNRRLTLGSALIGRARLSLKERGVPIWLETRLCSVIREQGRVIGAVIERRGETLRIRARRGVLLAAGGFERNSELRRKYQPSPIASDWTMGADSNTGDTLAIGESLGAALDLLDESWWCPVLRVPSEDFNRVVVFEKNLPGSIMINRRGERFMNEAEPYNDAGRNICRANTQESPAIPAYLVFDAKFRRKFHVGMVVMPGMVRPDWTLPEKLEGFLTRADSLGELARKIDVDAAGLVQTVEHFNGFAQAGVDSDFRRGESKQDQYYSVLADGPNPNLAAIAKPPFYAIKVWPGDLGTKGGLCTDARARVLSQAGEVIPGLYATGNCSASVMGRTYPGAGGTIGPSMTFGFIAAQDALAPQG